MLTSCFFSRFVTGIFRFIWCPESTAAKKGSTGPPSTTSPVRHRFFFSSNFCCYDYCRKQTLWTHPLVTLGFAQKVYYTNSNTLCILCIYIYIIIYLHIYIYIVYTVYTHIPMTQFTSFSSHMVTACFGWQGGHEPRILIFGSRWSQQLGGSHGSHGSHHESHGEIGAKSTVNHDMLEKVGKFVAYYLSTSCGWIKKLFVGSRNSHVNHVSCRWTLSNNNWASGTGLINM